MPQKFNVALALNRAMAESILDSKDIEFLRTFANFNPVNELPDTMTTEFMANILKDADACITC